MPGKIRVPPEKKLLKMGYGSLMMKNNHETVAQIFAPWIIDLIFLELPEVYLLVFATGYTWVEK